VDTIALARAHRQLLDEQPQTGDLVRQSTIYFTPVSDSIQRQDPYVLVDANITVRPRQHWLSGSTRNLMETATSPARAGSRRPRLADGPASLANSGFI
jgi:hypothetical protein